MHLPSKNDTLMFCSPKYWKCPIPTQQKQWNSLNPVPQKFYPSALAKMRRWISIQNVFVKNYCKSQSIWRPYVACRTVYGVRALTDPIPVRSKQRKCIIPTHEITWCGINLCAQLPMVFYWNACDLQRFALVGHYLRYNTPQINGIKLIPVPQIMLFQCEGANPVHHL